MKLHEGNDQNIRTGLSCVSMCDGCYYVSQDARPARGVWRVFRVPRLGFCERFPSPALLKFLHSHHGRIFAVDRLFYYIMAMNNPNGLYFVIRGNDEADNEEKNEAFNRASDFVLSIMNASPDPIRNSDSMTVVRNVFDLETGETRDIILRNITEPFWQACINVVNTPRLRVAAVGTPGIGKTTSTPWLIRMLLEQKQTVVYLIRTEDKSSWYYEFIPHSNVRKVTINVYPEALTKNTIPSLKCPDTYYIVDPGRSKDNCDPPANFQAKVILVPSPDARRPGPLKNFSSLGRFCAPN